MSSFAEFRFELCGSVPCTFVFRMSGKACGGISKSHEDGSGHTWRGKVVTDGVAESRCVGRFFRYVCNTTSEESDELQHT